MLAGNSVLNKFCTSDVDKLKEKGFVHPLYVEGHQLEDLRLTDKGKAYMEQYPSLRNPISKETVSLIIALLSLLVGIAALFVACTILKNQHAEMGFL